MTLSILLGIEGIWQLIVLLLLYFLLYVIPITLCAKRARKFNRNGIAWGILGFFFSYIAVLFVYRLPAEKTKVEVVSETNRGKMEQQKKRPTVITVMCVLGFIRAIASIPTIILDIAEENLNWYHPYLGLEGIIGFVCMVGLWKMKKWATFIFAGFVGLNQIVYLTMGIWDITVLFIPAIIVGTSLAYVKKMD